MHPFLNEILKTQRPVVYWNDQLELDHDDLAKLWTYLENNHLTFYIAGMRVSPHQGGETEDLLAKINHKLKENADRYPTDFEHCLLSDHVYYDESHEHSGPVIIPTHDEASKFNNHLADWTIEKILNNKNDGYYGVIYRNDRRRQLVLAHRGTEFNSLSDITTDVEGIFLGSPIQGQVIDCHTLTKQAVELTRQLGYSLSITGHSLGAWLAEMSIYFCYHDFHYFDVKVVNFDSPGSQQHTESLSSNINNQALHFKPDLNIVTYLSRPNLINTCNKHTGLVLALEPKIEVSSFETSLNELLKKHHIFFVDAFIALKGHSIIYFLNEFNPDTGKPNKCKLVKDWPYLKISVVNRHRDSFSLKVKNYFNRRVSEQSTANSLSDDTMSKISPDIVNLMDLSSVLKAIVSGKIHVSLDQYESFLKNAQYGQSASDQASEINLQGQFKLKYQGHYSVVDLSSPDTESSDESETISSVNLLSVRPGFF